MSGWIKIFLVNLKHFNAKKIEEQVLAEKQKLIRFTSGEPIKEEEE
jgi:hypothetical protein